MSISSRDVDVRPSQYFERATVWLLGLSFGEHDDGAQRTAISLRIAEIINVWVSGLLAADFPTEEVESTFSAFSRLIQTEDIPSLINWSVISISDVDRLIHAHWVRAARNMVDLPLPPSKPLEIAIDSLNVSLKLLDCIAAKDSRRSAAANTAPGDLVFSALRLFISTEHQHDQNSLYVRVLYEKSISHLCRMRRCENKSQLFSSLLNHMIPLIRDAVQVDLSTFEAPYVVHDAAPTSHVLHSLLCEVDENKLSETAWEILPILHELVESVPESIRLQSLHSISLLCSRVPISILEPERTAKSLQLSLSWGDVPTSMIAFPLLATFLPKMKPKDSRGEEHFAAVSKVIENIVRHMQTREQHPDPDVQGSLEVGRIKAAIELSTFVPSLLKELMVYRVDWIIALSAFLPQLASFVKREALEAADITQALTVLQESMKWAWLRVDSFRKDVFEGCISLLMEARSIPDFFLIQAAVRNVIVQLGKCGQVERLMEMTKEVCDCAEHYESLSVATNLCKEVEDIFVLEGSTQHKNTINAGSLVKRFFPELV